MHTGSISNTKTKPGALYWYLNEYRGEWFSGWELAALIQSRCLSTYISAIRQQVGAEMEHETRGMNHFYRLATEVGE